MADYINYTEKITLCCLCMDMNTCLGKGIFYFLSSKTGISERHTNECCVWSKEVCQTSKIKRFAVYTHCFVMVGSTNKALLLYVFE